MANRKDADRESKPSSSRSSRRRLGRGLSSLISSPVPINPGAASDTERDDPAAHHEPGRTSSHGTGDSAASPHGEVSPAEATGGELQMVAVDAIGPNRLQPRQQFDESGLASLAMSIRSAGVMQPVILRLPASGYPQTNQIDKIRYELVAGERRWRAAKLAGLDRIPAIVRDIDDATAAEWALIENIQREDLNPIERAEAFRRLCDDFSLTHQEIAERVGLDRTSVTNLLRLLELDPETIDDVRAGRLTLGHARALLAITNINARRALVRQAVRQGWSVRALERRIKADAAPDATASAETGRATPAQIHLRHLAEELGSHLGTRVRIDAGRTKGSGKLIIDFYSLDEFQSLLDRLGYKPT